MQDIKREAGTTQEAGIKVVPATSPVRRNNLVLVTRPFPIFHLVVDIKRAQDTKQGGIISRYQTARVTSTNPVAQAASITPV